MLDTKHPWNFNGKNEGQGPPRAPQARSQVGYLRETKGWSWRDGDAWDVPWWEMALAIVKSWMIGSD